MYVSSYTRKIGRVTVVMVAVFSCLSGLVSWSNEKTRPDVPTLETEEFCPPLERAILAAPNGFEGLKKTAEPLGPLPMWDSSLELPGAQYCSIVAASGTGPGRDLFKCQYMRLGGKRATKARFKELRDEVERCLPKTWKAGVSKDVAVARDPDTTVAVEVIIQHNQLLSVHVWGPE